MVSRLLPTIELTTIAVAGFYFSWLFRKRWTAPRDMREKRDRRD